MYTVTDCFFCAPAPFLSNMYVTPCLCECELELIRKNNIYLGPEYEDTIIWFHNVVELDRIGSKILFISNRVVGVDKN